MLFSASSYILESCEDSACPRSCSFQHHRPFLNLQEFHCFSNAPSSPVVSYKLSALHASPNMPVLHWHQEVHFSVHSQPPSFADKQKDLSALRYYNVPLCICPTINHDLFSVCRFPSPYISLYMTIPETTDRRSRLSTCRSAGGRCYCWSLVKTCGMWQVYTRATVWSSVLRSASQEIPYVLWHPKVHWQQPFTYCCPEPD